MRVVVTGSGGRVGRAIFRRLSREHDVIGIDQLPASTAAQHVGDIADRRLLATAFAGAQAVIHTAALHAPHVGIAPEHEFERVNVEGTEAVISMAREMGLRRIVFTSSTAVYGVTPSAQATWIDEESETNPITIYHRTKLVAEELLRDAASCGIEVRVLRMSRCFPEPANLMAVYRLHRGIDARDVASAHEAALSNAGDPHQTLVVSGATPFTRSDVDGLAEDAPGVLRLRAPELVRAYEARRWPLPRTIDRVYASARAQEALPWRPRFGFAEVLSMLDQEHAEVLPPHLDPL